MTARNPRKITSDKIVDEVVCQCEYAVRTVPPAIFRIVMDDLIKEAERVNRDDVVLGLEGRWAPYNDNPRDGTAAANLGAQLVLARYDLFPELCARNRMCPNCTLDWSAQRRCYRVPSVKENLSVPESSIVPLLLMSS